MCLKGSVLVDANHHFTHRSILYAIAALILAACLSACSGGGSNSSAAGNAASAGPGLPASVTLADVCTVDGEKRFVRSYMEEKYLWYREIPNVDAGAYTRVVDYFKALLVTTPDTNNLPKDQFSFAIPTADADALSTGLNVGYGIDWTRDAQNRLRVAQIMPGSPAADAGMARGGHMAGVINYNVNSWYPNTAGAFVQFYYSERPGASQRVVYLDARAVQDESVPTTTTVTSPGGKLAGYILFSAHSQGAQDKLITAMRSLQDSGISELVLDMRYNSGGYLYIANTLATMVTGPQANGKVFEALRFNDKRTDESADSIYRFADRVEYAESMYPAGYALPRLNLRRVYILTSENTCSASESLINSLRGVDLEVILVGRTTCGKPYGFTRKDNCALSYYPIEFQGTNHKGFGDYSAGFAPTCAGSDDLDHALGETQEGLLSSALFHLDRGNCAPLASQPRSLLARPSEGAINPLSTERRQRGRWLPPQ